ncbi:hypothetical protein BXY66_1002 [Shimia isoporae]|uniref:Uncharacterized protein n=1 Tax=Shimia isoporae TaxID=647720 RepID=A0A4R1NMJ5_9RHOB|nr:hypothetical protein [Shimia isoporae]TCL08961.1 hypothetical protein BXY66_1002 [Shimia isoporae]
MKLIVLLFAAIWAPSVLVAELKSIQLHSYKHWSVDYVFSDEGEGWNACVMEVRGDGIALSLNIDGNMNADLQVFDAAADYSGWKSGRKFQLQIDRHPRWDMPANGRGNSLFVDLSGPNDWKRVDRLLYEIRQGLKLYVYQYGEREEYYWFSLRGSMAAANAIVEKCFAYLEEYPTTKSEPTPKTPPKRDEPVPGLFSSLYELKKEETSAGSVVYFNGTISRGFSNALKQLGDFDYLVIEQSNGGLLGEALAAGQFLRQREIATSIDGACASACVELYAGGVKRYYSDKAKFGVHAMAVDGDETSLSTTQKMLSERVKYFEAGGVDSRIVLDSLDTPSHELRWLSHDQAVEYGLIE